MCQVLGVSKSGYYNWRKRPKSEQKKRKEALTKKVKRIFIESKERYGSPKITEILRQQGIHTTERTVSNIMRENNLRSKVTKKYKATTNSKHNLPVFPNRLNQNFKVNRPGEVWVSDITYIWTKEGWLYLASVMDLFSRRIIG
jgi:transposase InsO family protein